jgi:hypothetical protein
MSSFTMRVVWLCSFSLHLRSQQTHFSTTLHFTNGHKEWPNIPNSRNSHHHRWLCFFLFYIYKLTWYIMYYTTLYSDNYLHLIEENFTCFSVAKQFPIVTIVLITNNNWKKIKISTTCEWLINEQYFSTPKYNYIIIKY